MKKIISMLVVAVMLCSLSLVAFAAPTATFDGKEVVAGTTEVTVDLALNFTETTGVYAMSLMFVAEGATITAVDTSKIDAVIPKSAMSDAATFYYTWMDDNAATYNYDFAAGSYVIPVTVTLNSTEAGATATVGVDAVSSMIMEGNTGNAMEVTFPTATITVKENKPVFVPETKKGATVEGTDNVVLEKDPASATFKNTYEGTAVFAAELGADVKYGEAGFIWVKDDVESTNKFTVDASVIAGGGTFEYAVAMYAIPTGVDIDAIPYYVTAE